MLQEERLSVERPAAWRRDMRTANAGTMSIAQPPLHVGALA